MSNSLLTINMITRAAVRLWKNSNAFVQNIESQYDDQFARTGAKIGDSLRIRLPNEYTVRTGVAASVQDTNETQITMSFATQKGVDTSFTSADLTLKLDDYVERILAPKISFLTADVAQDIMNGSEGGVCNYVANTSGSTILSPTQQTYLEARAVLDNNSAPPARRKVINSPTTEARVVSTLTGLLNPAPAISRQYMQGQMYDALGFRWFSDQTVINHTGGTFSAGTVSGADQTGNTLATNAITGTLKQGDIITLEAVYGVNRLTRQSTGQLRQFVVTDDVASGATSIPIYPAITPPVGGSGVQYQTVTASPANGAAISLVNPASTTYRKNIAYIPDMVTMATADLTLPGGVQMADRQVFDSISMRSVVQYAIGTDQEIDRLDVLYAFLFVRPEWGVIVADAI